MLDLTRNGRFYRCKKCNRFYAVVGKDNYWEHDDIETFKQIER